MTDCYCDYERPIIYDRTTPVARKEHKCYECQRTIPVGARYESVRALWERGDGIRRIHICGNCVNLREWVEGHIPCACWSHGNMIEECFDQVREFAHEAPGLLFGAWRRYKSPKFSQVERTV